MNVRVPTVPYVMNMRNMGVNVLIVATVGRIFKKEIALVVHTVDTAHTVSKRGVLSITTAVGVTAAAQKIAVAVTIAENTSVVPHFRAAKKIVTIARIAVRVKTPMDILKAIHAANIPRQYLIQKP